MKILETPGTFKNLGSVELLRRANEALDLPSGKNPPPEDECIRVELAQRYINLLISIRSDTSVQP